MPPLAVLLAAAEQKKGSPLTEDEVLALRDKAIVMMNRPEVAKTLDDSRGYRDVDPKSPWSDWHRLRAQLGHVWGVDFCCFCVCVRCGPVLASAPIVTQSLMRSERECVCLYVRCISR